MDKFDEIFLEVMPESEKSHFVKRVRNNKDYDHKKATTALAKALTTEYVDEETQEVLSPQDIINLKTIGYVMANPSPQNTKALYETAGIAAPKTLDVTSGGKPIDKYLEGIAIKDGDDGEEN